MKLSSRRARLAAAAALALVIGVPASLGATGFAAKVVGLSETTPTAAQYPSSKVTICHHTHSRTNPFVTITVSQNALPAHLGHGDTVGACSQTPPAAPVAPAAHKLKQAHKAKHSAGKSGLHGHHGKPAKTLRVKTHGKSGETHGAPATSGTTVHGQSQATTHGKSHQTTHGNGQANGKSQTHGHGQGQGNGNGKGQTQTHGQGQGNGQGHGQGDTHGNGGGNGKGH